MNTQTNESVLSRIFQSGLTRVVSAESGHSARGVAMLVAAWIGTVSQVALAFPWNFYASHGDGSFSYTDPTTHQIITGSAVTNPAPGSGISLAAPGAGAYTSVYKGADAYSSGGLVAGNQVWLDLQHGTSPTSQFNDQISVTGPILCEPGCTGGDVYASVSQTNQGLALKSRSQITELFYAGGDGSVSDFRNSEAIFYDQLTLSQDATVVLTGHMDGSLFQSSPFSEIPRSIFTAGFTIGDATSENATDLGGITLTCDLGQPCANGLDRTFSVTLNLPGGTLIDFNTALFTKAGAAGWMTSLGRSTADFGDTASFQLIVPEGVTVTSASGFFPVATVPVPPAVWLFGSGLLGLVGVARRRSSHERSPA